jgi:hypothetical protein
MLHAAFANVAYNARFAAVVPWAVIPLSFYAVGMAFAAPAMNMRIAQHVSQYPRARLIA